MLTLESFEEEQELLKRERVYISLDGKSGIINMIILYQYHQQHRYINILFFVERRSGDENVFVFYFLKWFLLHSWK